MGLLITWYDSRDVTVTAFTLLCLLPIFSIFVRKLWPPLYLGLRTESLKILKILKLLSYFRSSFYQFLPNNHQQQQQQHIEEHISKTKTLFMLMDNSRDNLQFLANQGQKTAKLFGRPLIDRKAC